MLQHVTGLSQLRLVLFIRKRVSPAVYSDALDLESLALQGQNLSSNKAVTDFRVLVDEIGNLQGRPCILCLMSEIVRVDDVDDELDLTINLGECCDIRR